MAQSKMARLAQRLSEKTSNGELDWERTVRDNTFNVAFPNYSVQISQSPSEIGEEDYYITIFNENGNILESISDVELDREEQTIDNHTYFKLLRSTFDSARRFVLGTDKAIDSILSILED